MPALIFNDEASFFKEGGFFFWFKKSKEEKIFKLNY
jgi:hypothetical protein